MIRGIQDIQHSIATESLLLPVAVVVAILLWIAGGVDTRSDYLSFLAPVISTPMMVELNNANALLRIRSRMVTSIFLVLWGISPFLHPYSEAHWILVCMLISYHTLFHSYQRHDDTRDLYICFISLGVMMLKTPQLMVLIPVFLTGFFAFQSLSFRSLMAGLFGLLTPFWIWAAWLFLTDRIQTGFMEYVQSIPFEIISYKDLTGPMLITTVFVLVLGVISSIDFLSTSFKDKIRVRTIFNFLVWMEVILTIMLITIPSHFESILLLLILNTSPLAAHFLAQSSQRWTGLVLIAAMIFAASIAIYNIWMPSPSF